MKQNENDASQPAHEHDEIEVEAQTLRRLESIRTPDESPDDTLNRVLDDAVKNVPIEEIMTDLLDQFGDSASICVDLNPESPGMLVISVHTGDVGAEEQISFYEESECRAVIESQTGDRFCLPFYAYATSDGPRYETINATPVHRGDNVLGSDAVTLKEGLDQLRAKIGKSRDEVRELVPDI